MNPKRQMVAKKNGWFLDAPPGKYAPYREQMDALMAIIQSKIDIFRPICEKYYCEFSCALFIYRDNGESTPWVHLDSNYNKLIRELNIEFDLDIYCF